MRFNPLTPELNVSHFETSLFFYTQVLGFAWTLSGLNISSLSSPTREAS